MAKTMRQRDRDKQEGREEVPFGDIDERSASKMNGKHCSFHTILF